MLFLWQMSLFRHIGQVSAFHSFPTYYLSFYISVRGFLKEWSCHCNDMDQHNGH